MPKFSRDKFFAGVRAFLKTQGMTLTQKRTDALEFLIGAFERTSWTIPQIAYAFATIFHETAHTFEPIYEYGPKSYFNKYEPGTRIGRNLGNTEKGDGYRYRGAGFVQITGRSNYRKFAIEHDPGLALNPAVAFEILRRGMEKGSFTGKKLTDYISDTGKDYKGARKIINGTDKAALIAKYAIAFEDILRASKTSAAVPQVTSDTSDKTKPQSIPSEQPSPDFTEGERPVNETAVNIDVAENVNVENKPPPSLTPATVKVERASIFTKIGAAFAAITALGINLGNVSTTKLNELTPQQIVWLLGAVLLIAGALWFYDRAAKRAHEKTLAKMKTAADPGQTTVELREQK